MTYYMACPHLFRLRTLACHWARIRFAVTRDKKKSFRDRVTPRSYNNKSVVILNPVSRFDFERIDLAIG